MALLERARVEVYLPDLPTAARYADELKRAAFESLSEEAILVVVTQVYHAV